MNTILDLAENDNFVTSIECNSSLIINITKWNGSKCRIIGTECCRLLLNSTCEFEIGEIVLNNIKVSDDLNDFVSENKSFSHYRELIIYDAWRPDTVNFRAICKEFNSEIIGETYQR